jgi:hypothetical protein
MLPKFRHNAGLPTLSKFRHNAGLPTSSKFCHIVTKVSPQCSHPNVLHISPQLRTPKFIKFRHNTALQTTTKFRQVIKLGFIIKGSFVDYS